MIISDVTVNRNSGLTSVPPRFTDLARPHFTETPLQLALCATHQSYERKPEVLG